MSSSYKTLNTFTKDMGKLEIPLIGFNEISGVTRGFMIMNADKIEIQFNEESTSQSVGIFIYKNEELIAKDFVFHFKDTDKIVFDRMYINDNETFCYGFKYLEA